MSSPLNPEATLPTGFVAFTHEGVLLGYDPLTGRGMRWLTKRGGKCKTRQWAAINPGTQHKKYTQIWINAATVKWHRIIAQHFINGGRAIPPGLEVDHIQHVDGTAAQDRLSNLRLVSSRENRQNLKAHGSSKFPGVSRFKPTGKWQTQAVDPITGKNKHLGLFSNEREAAQAYIDFCIQHGIPHAPAATLFYT